MPEAKPAGWGRKLATVVAVQAPEAKPLTVQIGPSQDAPKAAGQNRAERRRREHPKGPHPTTRTAAPGTSPAAGPPRFATTTAGRNTTCPPSSALAGRPGRGFRPRQAGARGTARGSVLLSAELSTASTRHHAISCVEVICTGRTNMTGTSTPGRLASKRGALTRADGEAASEAKRPNRRKALPVGDRRTGDVSKRSGKTG